MVSIQISELIVCFICMIMLGMFLCMGAYLLGTCIYKYENDKKFILDYIKQHKRGNELPSKLIYKYLSRDEKQNILKIRGEK